jgi:hypothetical protein
MTQISHYDHLTGIHIQRDMTEAEQAEYDQQVAEVLIAKEQAKAEAESLRNTKIEAYKKLALTDDEIEALLPSPKPPVFF